MKSRTHDAMQTLREHPGRHMLDGTIRVFLAEALFPLTALITVAFLTRRLGPEGYGLLTLAATIVLWVEASIDSLFTRATIKLVGKTPDWQPLGLTVIRFYVGAGTVGALLLWLLASPIAGLLHEPMLATYLALFALDIPLHSMAQAHRNILVGTSAFRPRALATACRWIVRLLLIVVLVEAGFSVPGAILGSIGASLIELTVSRFYVRPPLFRVFRGTAVGAKQLWTDAIPLFLFAISLSLCHRLDLVMLKILGGTTAQAGIYGAAQNLAGAPGIVAISFSPLLLSTMSRLLHGGESQQANEMGRNAMRAVIGLLPFAAMIAGAAPEIVAFVFGPVFLPAAPLLAVLIFGTFSLLIVSVATAILTASNRTGWTFALAGPLVPLVFLGHIFLIPRLGPTGASLVTALAAFSGALLNIVAVDRLCRIRPPAATLLRTVLICGLAYALAAFLPTDGYLLLLKISVIALVIPLAFFLLGEFSAGEIALVRSMAQTHTTPERSPG